MQYANPASRKKQGAISQNLSAILRKMPQFARGRQRTMYSGQLLDGSPSKFKISENRPELYKICCVPPADCIRYCMSVQGDEPLA